MIVVVDTGIANLGSLRNMFKRIGQPVLLSADAPDIANATKLVLPGVGAFDTGMQRLTELDLVGPLSEAALERRIPVLGVCLGMQLITKGSEEGTLPGLGWIDAETIAFRRDDPDVKVPHMGWNTVSPTRQDTLFKGLADDARFYFVHSFHVRCADDADVLGWTTHGSRFASAVQHENVMGTQFHPEKSHRFGMALLASFSQSA
jgi:glutamine amidotransferase